MEIITTHGYERIRQPEDPKDLLQGYYFILAFDPEDRKVEWAHFHRFYNEDEANAFRDKVEAADVTREHLETSEHWVRLRVDTRSFEEKMQAEAERERLERYHGGY